jgi:hypothetical protein
MLFSFFWLKRLSSRVLAIPDKLCNKVPRKMILSFWIKSYGRYLFHIKAVSDWKKTTFLTLQEVENKLFLNLKLAWKTHFGILFKVKRTKIPNLQ